MLGSERSRRGHRGGALVVTFALMAGVLAVMSAPVPGIAAEDTIREMKEVGPADTGYEALVNTLGLRTVMRVPDDDGLPGMYVTNADGRRRMKAAVANQVFTEMGVFRDVWNRFKLLGADGQWVKLRLNAAKGKYETGTWAKAWGSAWSFKLVRPKKKDVAVNVVSELIDNEIDRAQPVCVKAFGISGNYRGLLGVSKVGTMVLQPKAKCGKSLSTLFMTDTVPIGTPPKTVAEGVEIDRLTYTKFVAPDQPALTLGNTRRELMRQDIEDYFFALRAFNDGVRSDVANDITEVTNRLLTTSYVIPGDEAEDVNLLDFFVDQTTTLLALVPKGGDIAAAAIQVIYDSVSLGVAIAHNQNLEGPRVVESVTNEVLTTSADIMHEYDVTFSDIGETIDAMKQQLLEGCPDRNNCTSDRTLAAWWDADPNADLPVAYELSRQQTVASHELVVWKRLLPIRGRLWQPDPWFYMPGKAGSTNCSPGYPRNSPLKNFEILDRYAEWVAVPPGDASNGDPLVVTHVYYPYQNEYTPFWCAGKKVYRAYQQAWTIGLANDDDAAVTPVSKTWRLFDLWDPDEPLTSGFGLSRQEVACQWLDNKAHGYVGSNGRYFNPCHFAFYDAAGAKVSPHEDESVHYATGAPNSAAYWVPSAAEVETGRPETDPDVVSSSVSKLSFRSCTAFDAGEIKSTAGGAAVTVHFTNLHDGDIAVRWIQTNGNTTPAFTMVRQDKLARPFEGSERFGQFELDYSDPVSTSVGTAFVVNDAAGDCLGTWTVEEMPANPAVPYAVAEIHGPDGILLVP